MIKSILKWTGILIGSILVLLTITVSMRQNIKYDAPFPKVKASTDSAVIARGKYLAVQNQNCTTKAIWFYTREARIYTMYSSKLPAPVISRH